MASGKFITFEGGEGSGKSTQAHLLCAFLRTRGVEVVVTREPGGTALAEQIRDLLLGGSGASRSALTEALLFYAARADHLEAVIRPALARGAWVICDRFSDSTRVYQGAAGDLAAEVVEGLDRIVVGATRPHLTLLMDLDARLGLQRVRARKDAGVKAPAQAGSDPYEARGLEFHERLRRGYLAIAAAEPERFVIIDAGDGSDAVEMRVRDAVLAHFGSALAGKSG